MDNSYTQAKQNANNAAHDSEKADEWKIGLRIVLVGESVKSESQNYSWEYLVPYRT